MNFQTKVIAFECKQTSCELNTSMLGHVSSMNFFSLRGGSAKAERHILQIVEQTFTFGVLVAAETTSPIAS